MAAITTGVIGAVGAVGSAASSMKAAHEQGKQGKRSARMAAEGQMRNVAFDGGEGGPSASFDPATGQMITNLGDRLGGQQGQLDAFAQMFGGQVGGPFGQQAGGFLGAQQGVAGMGPQANNNFFNQLQGQIGGARGLAQGQINQAASFGNASNALGNQAFGIAGQQLGDIGTFDQVRGQQLDLLRQQAAPFEQRAFSNLQDNQFATGRLGSTGGALQTEAFARGLGQADLDRQLSASGEARNVQNNAMGLASGSFGLGAGQRGLADTLLGNAFNNFSGFAGLGADVQNAQFGQNMGAQNNNFNQLQSMFGNSMGLEGFQQQSQGNQFNQFLQAMGAGNALDNIPLDRLGAAASLEQQRSSSALGGAQVSGGINVGQGADAAAAAFGGLGQFANGGGLDFLQGLGGNSAPTSPYAGGNLFNDASQFVSGSNNLGG